jgi:hypothetical protein
MTTPNLIDPATACTTTRYGIKYVMQRTPENSTDTLYGEDWTPQTANASFVALVKWAESALFVKDMLGEHRQAAGQILRWNPNSHPYFDFLYCVGCKIIGNYGRTLAPAGGTNAVQYEYCAIACTFGAFLYDIKDDSAILQQYHGNSVPNELLRYVERRGRNIGQSLSTSGAFEYATPQPVYPAWDVGTTYASGDKVLYGTSPAQANYYSLANGNIGNVPSASPLSWKKLVDDNALIPTPPALMCPYREMTYTWRYVPGPLDSLITRSQDLYGTVNSTPFDVPYCAATRYPAGTVMYLGMEEEPIVCTPAGNVNEDRLYHIPHKFAYRKQGWNAVYRPNLGAPPGDWDQARNRATGAPPYGSADFQTLFQI